MSSVLKKAIQRYWTKNVPGLDTFSRKYSPEQKEFYIEAERYRHKYEPSVIPLIDSFAAKGRLVLEVGCGLGYDTRYISRKGADVIGLDLSVENVRLTMKGMQLLNLNGKGVCADAEHLPFKDDIFDVAYSFGVLHHTPHTEKAIMEIYRILKPEGKCIVMLYHKGYAYYFLLLRYAWKSLLFLQTKEELMSKYDNTPLSKMYSRHDAKKLFYAFKDLKFEVATYGGIQNHVFLKYLWIIFNKANFLMQRFGSFLIIKAAK